MARALAANPPVLLMDEPFGAVDPVVRVRLQDEFLRLQQELGKTVVLVTHDIDEAVKMGDRVAVFAAGGRLAQYATPAELLARPADDYVADFVGSTSGLRRLSVTPINRDHLEPMDGVNAGELAAAVDLDSSLEEALAAMLRDDRPMVGVKDGAQFVGVLTPNGVHQALRASLADARPGQPTVTSRCQDSVTYFVSQPSGVVETVRAGRRVGVDLETDAVAAACGGVGDDRVEQRLGDAPAAGVVEHADVGDVGAVRAAAGLEVGADEGADRDRAEAVEPELLELGQPPVVPAVAGVLAQPVHELGEGLLPRVEVVAERRLEDLVDRLQVDRVGQSFLAYGGPAGS